jgi:hypothetical protein
MKNKSFPQKGGVYFNPSYYCWFTGQAAAGIDLVLYSDCNVNNSSHSALHPASAYENYGLSHLSTAKHFQVSEVEVFEISFGQLNKSSHIVLQSSDAASETLTTSISHATRNAPPLKESSPAHSLSQTVKTSNSSLQKLCDNIIAANAELDSRVGAFRDELIFVAQFVGITSPSTAVCDSILDDIKGLVELLKCDRVASSSIVAIDSTSIVTINAGGTVLAVSKATLQQAPSGSILANMTSDVWGHDLDSEGNIIQDVNSELFTAIINHLRLKALLPVSEVPAIVVYESQRPALLNLLSFYVMSDVPIKCIPYVA